MFVASGCLGESKKSSSSVVKQPDSYYASGPITLVADYFADEGLDYTLDANTLFVNLPNETYTYSINNKANWMSLDTNTGIITGVPDQNKVYQNIVITATETLSKIEFKTEAFSLGINGDPLRRYMWHLNNTGQNAFSSGAGVSGIDINSFNVYKNGITGEGIRIAVSDSGVEIKHDDLFQNIIQGVSRDYTLEPPYIGTPIATSAHGTAVSGLIAARGWNNIGLTGVAPKASLAGFQFLSSSQSSSILIHQANGDFDIFNYSYGDFITYDTRSDADYVDFLRYRTANGRSSLGSFYIKAAGNEFMSMDDNSNPSICAPHNANFPLENESPFMMVIGAVNADGEKAFYSNAGSNIWVSAPGGEYGITDPAMISTDLPTCFKGYSKAETVLYNDFEYGHDLNPKCNYTSTMNGTSSAVPVTSGVVALVLAANPALKWRDVKHILAATAVQVDVGHSSWSGTKHPSESYGPCPTLTLTGHTYELGWVANTAGFKFNNFYGFGLIDADAAVALALDSNLDTYNMLPLPALIETNPDFDQSAYDSGSINLEIPDNHKDGATNTQSITSSAVKVESVQVRVQVTHPASGEIGVELTSPGGTKSILMNINNSFLISGDSNLDIVLGSHAFYGETLNGNWKIKVIDGKTGNAGHLVRWRLNFLGH